MKTFRIWTKDGKGPVSVTAESFSTEYGVLIFWSNLGTKCVMAFAAGEWRWMEEVG